MNKRPGGFTLIELLVTVFVAVILIGVAVPSFRTTIANNRLVTQTNDLVAALTLARSEAITRNASMTFCRTDDPADTDCAGDSGSWSSWIIRNPAGEVVRSGTIPTYGGALKVTSTLTGDAVTYSSDGLARTGSAGTLLTNAHSLRVCVSTTSRENIRNVTPGAGSRLSTTKETGTC